jgi:predicted nuclease of predicted toxin-antitoxin system
LKFLVDSAVSPEVAEGLRAEAENRIVVTSDTDFGELLAESGASRPSIILFRRGSGKPSEENALLARALSKPEVCENLQRGGIVVVDPRRVRIRKLPLGSTDE